MFSDLIIEEKNNKQTKNKEGLREHFKVMDKFMTLMVMIVSQVYTYLQIHHFTLSIIFSFL